MKLWNLVLVGLMIQGASVAHGERVPTLSAKDADVSPLKESPVDYTLFRKHKKLYNKFWALKKHVAQVEDMSREDSIKNLKDRWEILKKIVKKEPKFVAGYWLMGDTGLPYASSFTEEKDLPFARGIFVEIEKANRKCLKIAKDNENCKFFLGAALGKIATIDGIFASLKSGREILDLWDDVFESPYNYRLDPGVSMKGNVGIGLGMFYRLVPNFFLIRWFFDISGDIDKSIFYHQKAKEVDGIGRMDNTLNLACSLLCKSGGDKKAKETKEANKLLDYLMAQKSSSSYFQTVIAGAGHVKKNPGDACGYTIARIQETDEEEFKKMQEKKKK